MGRGAEGAAAKSRNAVVKESKGKLWRKNLPTCMWMQSDAAKESGVGSDQNFQRQPTRSEENEVRLVHKLPVNPINQTSARPRYRSAAPLEEPLTPSQASLFSHRHG
ncbi:hypothetical protein CYMTET_26156 [Cymbomonas tetramitiformis]|uniref:Uncharacterized protein n=1 Tax=Cymbomonas tetramitiformis TaxID=36881 RepID=A0AAE0KY62_9CHLO|nr:hypothetical protein CYMTET_26156 [Cymbomonas tetramitiformis]